MMVVVRSISAFFRRTKMKSWREIMRGLRDVAKADEREHY